PPLTTPRTSPRPTRANPAARTRPAPMPATPRWLPSAKAKTACGSKTRRQPASPDSLHLQELAFRGRQILRLVHRLHARRTDPELARVHDLHQVEMLHLFAAEVLLEDGH